MRRWVRGWLVRRWVKRLAPEEYAQLLVRFAVDERHPLLEGVLLVVRGERERCVAMGMGGNMPGDRRAWACGGVAALEELEGRLVELVAEARRRAEEKGQGE